MKTGTLVLVLSALLAGWMGGGTWFWVCKVKGHCPEESELSSISNPEGFNVHAPQPMDIKYKDSTVLRLPDNFRFAKSDHEGVSSQELDNQLHSLTSYLNSNPNQDLEIIGLYSPDEHAPKDYQGIGLARADFLRKKLIGQGVAPNRLINSQRKSTPSIFDESDTARSGLVLTFLDGDHSDPEAEVLFTSNNLHFEFNSSNIAMTEDLRAYISKTIQYLNRHTDQKLVITGHTSSEGKTTYNMKLGQRRADFIAEYFSQLGLESRQMEAVSKGESEPLTSNASEEGKEKNRRVSIQVK